MSIKLRDYVSVARPVSRQGDGGDLFGGDGGAKLTGTVEADETYVGGKPRLYAGDGYARKSGRGTDKGKQ